MRVLSATHPTESLERRLVERFVQVLVRCQQAHMSHLDTLKSAVAHVEIKFNEVNVITDQNLFIEYNLRTFASPADWKFEPCDIHYDTVSNHFSLRKRLFHCAALGSYVCGAGPESCSAE